MRRNVASNTPIKSATITDMTITTTVSLIASSRVGHVTFFSSDTTSFTNFAGLVAPNDGIIGLSIQGTQKTPPGVITHLYYQTQHAM